MRSDQRVVFGHEFSGEVTEYGSGCRKRVPTGTPVVALPMVRSGPDVHAIGLSTVAPGAYAERVVVEESLMLAVPNGLTRQLRLPDPDLVIASLADRPLGAILEELCASPRSSS